ncbi:MAG: DUF2934 domain-containing protein [Nitrospira sp.]
MQKSIAIAKNPMRGSIDEREKRLGMPANGAWDLIAIKAYELYEQRGCIGGHALEDWLKAEALVNGETK